MLGDQADISQRGGVAGAKRALTEVRQHRLERQKTGSNEMAHPTFNLSALPTSGIGGIAHDGHIANRMNIYGKAIGQSLHLGALDGIWRQQVQFARAAQIL